MMDDDLMDHARGEAAVSVHDRALTEVMATLTGPDGRIGGEVALRVVCGQRTGPGKQCDRRVGAVVRSIKGPVLIDLAKAEGVVLVSQQPHPYTDALEERMVDHAFRCPSHGMVGILDPSELRQALGHDGRAVTAVKR